MRHLTTNLGIATIAAVVLVLSTNGAAAHCDAMDGPIVPEARASLESGNVTPLLKWVHPGDEHLVRESFERARSVRDRGDDVREVADQLFLETLIRVHRQSEGAPFTGIKPAGMIAPAFAAADAALDTGDGKALADRIGQAVAEQIHRRFAEALERRQHAGDSVEAGREYVEAYVAYLHFVEELHGLLERGAEGHGHDAAGAVQ